MILLQGTLYEVTNGEAIGESLETDLLDKAAEAGLSTLALLRTDLESIVLLLRLLDSCGNINCFFVESVLSSFHLSLIYNPIEGSLPSGTG